MRQDILQHGDCADEIRDIKEQIKALADAFQMEHSTNLLLLYEQFSYVLLYRCIILMHDNEASFLRFLPPKTTMQLLAPLDESRLTEEETKLILERAVKILADHAAQSTKASLEFLVGANLTISNPAIIRRMVQLANRMTEIINKTTETSLMKEFMSFMLERCSKGKAENPFETPGHIAEFVVRIIKDSFGDFDLLDDNIFDPVTKIYDPACGSGAFLLAVGKVIDDRGLYLRGYEKNESIWRVAALNCRFSGVDAEISNRNDGYKDEGYDIVLANPPFRNIRQYGDIRRILQSVASGGRGAMIVPDSYLFSTQRDVREARRWILREFIVEGVVSLPPHVFYPQAMANASVLFLSKPGAHKNEYATRHVLFYEAETDGFSKDSNRRPVKDNDLGELLNLWGQREYYYDEWKSLLGEASLNLSGIVTPAYWPNKKFWYADINDIETGQWSLLPKRYKPVERLDIAVEPPAEVLQKLVGIQQEILQEMSMLIEEAERN